MAEWLRRWTANPLGSARAGSNPADVELLHGFPSGQRGRSQEPLLRLRRFESCSVHLIININIYINNFL